MIRYICRESVNSIKKKYTAFYAAGMLVLCLLANIAMACFRSIYGMNDGAFAYNLIIFAEGAFIIPYYTCIFLADILFGKSCVNPHIKDSVTRKLHRWQIYLGKLIAAFILGVVLYLLSFVFLVGTTALFAVNDASIDIFTIQDFIEKSLVALPLWMAGISIGQMFLFSFDDKRNAFSGYYIVVFLIPRVILTLASEKMKVPGFKEISEILITPQFQALQYYFTMDKPKCYLIGFIYTLISSAIGIWVYYHKENFKM